MGASGFASLTPMEPLIDACVHCGFCLPTCPSYLLLGQEMDSPRGRIVLMKAGADERISMSGSVVAHFDTCLGCMACETACPSGVRYAPLIEETRAAIETHHRRSVGDRLFRRLLFLTLPHPARLRLVALPLSLLTRWPRVRLFLPGRIRRLLALAPEGRRSSFPRDLPERTPAVGEARLRVGLLTGCVQRVFFGGVNQATARVLSAEGCDVHAPSGQGCCGALALHAGRRDDARFYARRLIEAFDGSALDRIVVNAAGCGSAMKEYGSLLADDPLWVERARAFAGRVVDLSEALAGLDPARAERRPLKLRVAYHDACHLAHAQGIRAEPRALLASIPGVTIVPLAEQEICCGSAGIFNLVQPEMAAALGQRKAAAIAASAPDVIVTSNPGCILQIGAAARAAGSTVPVLHIVELLDASLQGLASERLAEISKAGGPGPTRETGTSGPRRGSTVKRALALLAVFVAIPYYCGPIYDFPAPLAFSGPRLFNPYAGLSGHWQRANFHAHGRAWGGLTNGRQSSTEIAHWYRSHRYSVPGVSNYHRIAAHDGVQTMPIYEHGYNIAKRHQLAIGARKVDWFDFPIWQSLSHQQFVLDRLSRTTGLVALAHPTSRDAYTADDLTRLTGYDLIEIANGPFRSEAEWDAALSSGRPVWAIANDDTHDISDTQRLMVAWNMIDAPSASSADIISSLRAGRAYAVARNEESEAARDPVLDSVGVEGGTLVVTCRCPRSTFTFVGQGGSVRKTVKNATRAEYTFTDADTYIRTVIGSSDTFMYLNPVLRFDGRSVPDPVATVNQAGTWALRGSLAIGTAALVFVLVRRRRSSIRPSASGHTLSDATRKRA